MLYVPRAVARIRLIRNQSTMSVTETLSNPPWKKEVTEILQKNLDDGNKASLNFTLATIKRGSILRPSARTVVFRGFVGESKGSEHSEKLPGGNPPAESSLILVSTDALMPKVGELEESNGVFEICWWHAGTNQQIRFNGTAHVYRKDGKVSFPEKHLNRYIRTQGEWKWEHEYDRLWASHRPAMRGSFRNPPPGTPLNSEKEKKLKVVELDPEDDGPEAREAKTRFSMLVLEVKQLEILSLDPPPVSDPLLDTRSNPAVGTATSMDTEGIRGREHRHGDFGRDLGGYTIMSLNSEHGESP
jgi:pyridoxamine 5'-phosphate oxidase